MASIYSPNHQILNPWHPKKADCTLILRKLQATQHPLPRATLQNRTGITTKNCRRVTVIELRSMAPDTEAELPGILEQDTKH